MHLFEHWLAQIQWIDCFPSSLSERPSDGQRWRPQGHQPSCHLSLSGAGCPRGRCKNTNLNLHFHIYFLHRNVSSVYQVFFLHNLHSYFSVFSQFSSLSSFTEMSTALRLLSPENRTALPRESFRAFSSIMCGHPEVGGEQIPSLNWYEDNDIKSFLGKNGTEDTNLDQYNTTSKRLSTTFYNEICTNICSTKLFCWVT